MRPSLVLLPQAALFALTLADDSELEEVRYRDGYHGEDVFISTERFRNSDLTFDDPEYTQSINFTMPGRDEEWIWRVNITDTPFFGLSNSTSEVVRGVRTPGTTYDLQWPNASRNAREEADSFPSGPGGNLCASWYPVTFPPNVTNDFSDDGSASCESAFGSECLNAILEGMERGVSSGPGYCPYLPDLHSLDACNESVGISSDESNRKRTIVLSSDGTLSQENVANPSGPISNGELFALRTGDIVASEDLDEAFREAQSKLHMLILTNPGLESTAVCMRMDTEIDDWDVSERADEACLRDGKGELVQCDRGRLPDAVGGSVEEDGEQSAAAMMASGGMMGTLLIAGLSAAIMVSL